MQVLGSGENCVVDGESNGSFNPVTDSVDEEPVSELSLCDQDAVSTAPNANHADHSQSPSHLPGKNSSIDTEVSSAAIVAKDDQPKQEETLPGFSWLPRFGASCVMASVSSQPQFRYTQPLLKVLHLRNLPWECTEEELIELGKPFGKVVNTKCNVGGQQKSSIHLICFHNSKGGALHQRGVG
ncbi:uncharacterized protein [Spinacia oleracea]|uniref:RRM domain-containing protein n=1 Tax=Spinacia oleracea TaxID=3562 RepID=A0ABM3RMI3_SPIOL|nr:uncharacterized protein LOC130470540 [Spinacia oleracea]XP_056696822.1 uncharacterized protein LOC130470540 [Spinacia oleracea]